MRWILFRYCPHLQMCLKPEAVLQECLCDKTQQSLALKWVVTSSPNNWTSPLASQCTMHCAMSLEQFHITETENHKHFT